MRVMVIVKASPSSEAGILPSKQLMSEMGNFNEQLLRAGIMKSGDGLKPSSTGVRVQFSGTNRVVLDGPFAETKELIAGFWIWEVESMGEAIEWVKRCPNPMPDDSEIEIRPFFETSDFVEIDPSGEIAEHEQMLDNIMATQSSEINPYLFFSGRCEEALEFYRQNLGAEILMTMRYNECPDPVPEGMLQEGFENKIMHCTFKVGRTIMMASDGCDDRSNFDGFRLALNVASASDAHRIFDTLAEGGSVDMPLTQTFWSPLFGMVTDRFKVGWMISIADQQKSSDP